MNSNYNAGFSLIELMITIAIIGILAAIALPSYQEHVKQTRRQDAEAALVQFQQVMEKYYANRFTYKGAAESDGDTGAPAIFSVSTPLDQTGTKYYDLKITAASDTSFTLEAAPVAGTSQASDKCGTLTLSSNGTRSSGGSPTTICWED